MNIIHAWGKYKTRGEAGKYHKTIRELAFEVRACEVRACEVRAHASAGKYEAAFESEQNPHIIRQYTTHHA